jgi:hypothetical protein
LGRLGERNHGQLTATRLVAFPFGSAASAKPASEVRTLADRLFRVSGTNLSEKPAMNDQKRSFAQFSTPESERNPSQTAITKGVQSTMS